MSTYCYTVYLTRLRQYISEKNLVRDIDSAFLLVSY